MAGKCMKVINSSTVMKQYGHIIGNTTKRQIKDRLVQIINLREKSVGLASVNHDQQLLESKMITLLNNISVHSTA